jgi:large subunit ribosomal protein L23
VIRTPERDLADLIIRPVITEKATRQGEDDKYVFDVVLKATKPEIKAAIESLFDVTVTKVNTQRLPRKKKRVGQHMGYKTQYKRAIVTLADPEPIQKALYPEL